MWLESLKVPGGRIVKLGEIANSTVLNRPLVLKLKLSGGRTESKTFAEVVPTIFKQVLKDTPKTKRRVWPEPSSAKRKASPKVKTNPLQRRRERRAKEMEERYAGVASDNDYQPAATREDLKDEATKEITIPPSNEVSSSICTTFSGAIRSTQPHVGVEFLAQNLTSFNSIPSPVLTKQLYEMVVYGPKHDGTYYPDPHKSELVARYLSGAISRNHEVRGKVTELAMSRWQNMEDILVQVNEMIYRREGDDCSSSNKSLSRIANSLQVAANGLGLLASLIESQLKPFISQTNVTGELRDLSVVGALMDCDGGIREALKNVVRMNAQAWVVFGRFIAGDAKKLYAHEPRPSQANVHCCEKQLRRVFEAFGKLTSYVAWVYATEERMRMDTKKFASVIVDVFNNEIGRSKVDVDPFAAKKDKMKKTALNKYWEQVKLDYTISLVQEGDEFAEALQIKVAEVLGLQKKFFLIDL